MSNEVNQDTQVSAREKEIMASFSQHLENAGVFPRDYDAPKLKSLYKAAEALHIHLCKLDTGYYTEARQATLVSLANAYAQCHSGLRQLE